MGLNWSNIFGIEWCLKHFSFLVCVSLWYWEIVKVTYVPVCSYQKETKLGRKYGQQVRGDVSIGPGLVICVCHFIHSRQVWRLWVRGRIVTRGKVQWQDGKYEQRSKAYKGLLFRNGAFLIVVTHTCQAFENILYAEEEGRMKLKLGGGYPGSQAGTEAEYDLTPVSQGHPDIWLLAFHCLISALPLTELLSKEAVDLMS